MLVAYRGSQVAGAVARLGVAHHLAAGPLTAEDLAGRVGLPAERLYRLLRAAATVGVLDEVVPRSFRLSPLGQFLRPDVPGSLHGYAIALTAPGHWLPWGRLDEAVRSGRAQAPAALGAPLFDYYRANPEEGGHFAETMSALSDWVAGDVVRLYDFSRFRRVVDVGGSHGALLGAVLEANPGVEGVLLDLPDVVGGARAHLEGRGLAGRCEVVAGDFFEAVPSGGDAYLLKFILHDWPDEQARVILQRCYDAMAPGGRLLVLEVVLPPDGERSNTHLFDLNVLVLFGAQERTVEGYDALLSSAGFHLEEVVRLPAEPDLAILACTRA